MSEVSPYFQGRLWNPYPGFTPRVGGRLESFLLTFALSFSMPTTSYNVLITLIQVSEGSGCNFLGKFELTGTSWALYYFSKPDMSGVVEAGATSKKPPGVELYLK